MEDIVRKIADTPSQAINYTVDKSHRVVKGIGGVRSIKSARDYWHTLGPGLTTGAADDDPAGIATYSQTGSQYGLQLIWLAGLTFPLMAIIQEMCARIGLVTGRGLAGNIRIYYSKKILYTVSILLFAANALNIGADLGAMAKATQLLLPKADFTILIVLFTILMLYLQIYTSYEKYAKYLKWLALILLSYIFSALSMNLDVKQLISHAVIPSITFSKDQLFLICAILGTTISPYLFFWQTSQEVEEMIKNGRTTIRLRQEPKKEEISTMRTDVWSGMFLSNLVMFFIIAACAFELNAHGITHITTAEQAARALKPIAGENAYLLFALGLIGTGLLAIPVLAGSASYAVSESMKWKHGLYRKLKDAPSFYGIIILSMLVGLGLNFLHIDPIQALLYSAVANGLIAPIIIVIIVQMASNHKIMGEWKNSNLVEIFGWIVTILMVISGIAVIASMFF